MPASAMAVLAGSRRAFSIRWRRCSFPAMGYGLRYEYGIFKQTIDDGWQREQPDNWLRRPDPWEVARPQEMVEIKLGCSFELHGGSAARRSRPAVEPRSAFRTTGPIVGYGGKTINTLRLWAAATPDYLRFPGVQRTAISSAPWPSGSPRNRSPACSIPTIPRSMGQGLRFVQEYFLVACSLADLVRPLPARATPIGTRCPTRSRSSSTTRTRAMAVPELMRILLDEAGLGWDEAWDITRRDPRLHQPHAAARGAGEMAAALVRADAAAPARDHLRDQPPLPRRGAHAFPGDEPSASRG